MNSVGGFRTVSKLSKTKRVAPSGFVADRLRWDSKNDFALNPLSFRPGGSVRLTKLLAISMSVITSGVTCCGPSTRRSMSRALNQQITSYRFASDIDLLV